MKNKRAGLLSAKLTRKSNCPFIQKESFELSPSIINKTKKYNNLSLTINNNNKEKSYGLLSQNTKNFSTKFARSLSNNNIYPSFTKKNLPNLSIKNILSEGNNSKKFSNYSRANTQKGMIKSPSMILHKKYNRFFKLEDEKLFQEIYYLTRDINTKNKKLFLIENENKKKERILTEKENEINNIINKKNNNENTNIDELDIEVENYFKKIKSSIDCNNIKFNYNIIFNTKELNNSNYNNLFIRIKYQILRAFKEIKEIDDEIKRNKKLKRNTKMIELNTETNLLQSQIDQINILINNAIAVYNKNQQEMKEYKKLENSIYLQQNIIKKLNKEYEKMVIEEYKLNMQIQKMENALEKKNIKKYKNSKLIDVLTKKKQNLSKEKIFQEIYNKQEMKNKIKKLKKFLNIYKFNYEASNSKLEELKDEKNTLINQNYY